MRRLQGFSRHSATRTLVVVLAAWFGLAGGVWARPVRVEGDARWWQEISRAWDRFQALRSYQARGDLPRGGEVRWEVVRGRSPGTDDLRMVVTGRDSQGEWIQETVQKGGYEVWQVSWMPKKTRDPQRIRETERALEALGRRMAPDARASVRTIDTHHILCVRAARPLFIEAPGVGFRGALEEVRVQRPRRGTHMGPDRVMRPVIVYEYSWKDPRTGEWTTPQTLAVEERTGLPVQASVWGMAGSLGVGVMLSPALRGRTPTPAIVEYYNHNAPFTITVPPRGCWR